jgi:hypothetical protein
VIGALDRSFSHGCHDWVDVTAPRIGALGRRYLFAPTVSDRPWSALFQRYLASGDAILIIRKAGTGLDGYAKKALKSGGAAASNGKYVIYRTVPSTRVVHRRVSVISARRSAARALGAACDPGRRARPHRKC